MISPLRRRNHELAAGRAGAEGGAQATDRAFCIGDFRCAEGPCAAVLAEWAATGPADAASRLALRLGDVVCADELEIIGARASGTGLRLWVRTDDPWDPRVVDVARGGEVALGRPEFWPWLRILAAALVAVAVCSGLCVIGYFLGQVRQPGGIEPIGAIALTLLPAAGYAVLASATIWRGGDGRPRLAYSGVQRALLASLVLAGATWAAVVALLVTQFGPAPAALVGGALALPALLVALGYGLTLAAAGRRLRAEACDGSGVVP